MLTLIHGENIFEAEKELKKVLKNDKYISIHGDSIANLSELVSATDNLSLFSSEQSIVVVRNLTKNKRKSIMNDLAEYIERNPVSLRLILFESNKLDARTKLYKVLKKQGDVREFELLKSYELEKWVQSVFKVLKIEGSTTQIKEIIERVGTNQQIIYNELIKLKLLLKSEMRTKFQHKDLKLFPKNSEVVIWELLDAISARNKKVTVSMINDLCQTESDYPYLSSMLAKQLKLIYWIKSKEVTEMDMRTIFKVHPYTISKLKAINNSFDEKLVKVLYKKLTSLDFNVKQGKIDAKLGLIILFASV